MSNTSVDKSVGQQLSELEGNPARRAFENVLAAAASAIPGIGFLANLAHGIRTGSAQAEMSHVQNLYIEQLHYKQADFERDLAFVIDRLESMGPTIIERIESEEYLALVRSAARVWDRAETDEKRHYAANIITNAAAKSITSDDVIRLFIDWLDSFHEAHLAIVRGVYRTPGCTRLDLGQAVFPERLPREDSAEADLFRMIIRDLSTGGVIRQERETTATGEFVRQSTSGRRREPASRVLDSSFEDSKPYVLTSLGEQFVHYAITELVRQIGH